MRKIDDFLNEVIEDKKFEKELNEDVKSLFKSDKTMMLLLTFITTLASTIAGLFINQFNKKSILNKDFSDKISKLLDDEYEVYLFTSKLAEAYTSLMSNKKIYVSSKLLNICSDDETIAVILHEVAHLKGKHAFIKFFTGNFLGYTLAFTISAFLTALNPMLINVILSFVPIFISQKISNLISKQFESSADDFVVEKGYGTQLQSALKKVKKVNVLNLKSEFGLSPEDANKLFEEIQKDEYGDFQERLDKLDSKYDLKSKIEKKPNLIKKIFSKFSSNEQV